MINDCRSDSFIFSTVTMMIYNLLLIELLIIILVTITDILLYFNQSTIYQKGNTLKYTNGDFKGCYFMWYFSNRQAATSIAEK